MTRRTSSPDLTPEAARYLDGMRSLRPPVDLVEHVMVEIEATPQERLGLAALPRPVLYAGVAAVAAAVVALAVLLRPAPPNVGPQTTPSPEASAQSLDQLPSAGEVVSRTPADVDQVARFFAHGYLWMEDVKLDEQTTSGELVRVDPATGAFDVLDVTRRIGLELNAIADETSVWARNDVSLTPSGVEIAFDELVEINPESLTEVRRIPTRRQLGDYVVADGVAWFIDALANELVRLDLTGRAETIRVSLPAAAALLLDGDTLWVGREDGALSRLNAATLAKEDEYVTRVVAFDMSDAGDAILIYGGIGGLARVDKSTGAVTVVNAHEPGDDIPADEVGAPTYAGGRVWATTHASGHLVELDPVSLEPIAALQLGYTSFQGLVAGGDALWVVGIDSAEDAYLVQLSPTP
jgi:outer membrane protein assembly factor BamB